jgi:hypothetical protein
VLHGLRWSRAAGSSPATRSARPFIGDHWI